jgi:[acyl-carrier-protein] S-malonyltransferase
MKKTVFLFPGQGSQHVKMGKDFHDNYAIARELFEQASNALDMDLKKLCFEGPEADLIQTENVQPAVTLINITCFQVLKQEGITPIASAGHSLGEYSALFAGNVINFFDLMKLVKYRGAFMKEAAENNPGGMVAILGLEIDKIARICKGVKDICYAEIANHNSPKQVIVTGEKTGLEKVSELAVKNGAKLTVPLKVSGPWHSKFMAEAKEKLKKVIIDCTFKKPSIPIISNVTANYESEPDNIKTNLINQVTSPVLWLDSIEKFIRDGYTTFVEVGPGRVLRGLIKDINREVNVFNVENMKALQKFLSFHT